MLGFTFSVGDIHGRSTFSIEQDKSRSKVGGFDTIFSVVQTGPKSNLQSTQSIQSIWYQELCTPWHFIPTIYISLYLYLFYSFPSCEEKRKIFFTSSSTLEDDVSTWLSPRVLHPRLHSYRTWRCTIGPSINHTQGNRSLQKK